jgi:hypothetical protein
MKSLTINIPTSMEAMLTKFVSAGYFKTEEDLFIVALSDFIRRNQIELMEYFLAEDIKWAFQKKDN